MKKLFYACASVLCLALAAGVILLSGAGALRLLREPKREEAASAAASAPAPDQVSVVQVPQTAVELHAPQPEQNEPAEKPAPAAVEADEKVSPAPAPAGTLVYTVDFDRVMKNSLPGKAVREYAQKYAEVMSKNITMLNRALADKKKKYNVQEVKKTLEQCTKQRTDVWKDARSIVVGLIRSSAAGTPQLKDALLVDRKDALYLPLGLDRTDEIIALIDKVKLDVPDPPKPIEIK